MAYHNINSSETFSWCNFIASHNIVDWPAHVIACMCSSSWRIYACVCVCGLYVASTSASVNGVYICVCVCVRVVFATGL